MLRKCCNGALFLLIPALVVGTIGLPAQAEEQRDIVDTAKYQGSFETLHRALEAADLIQTLKGRGPFTVFAPTDAAFEKLPPGTLEALLADKQKLRRILLYHVISGRVSAADAMDLESTGNMAGRRLRISTVGGNVMIDRAYVTKADVPCRNGVIHVIDTVLIPEQRDIIATAKAAGAFRTLCKAVRAAELVETLQGEGPFTLFAPTDGAFAKLPPEQLESLLADKARLSEVLLYHVIPGKVMAADVSKMKSAKTVGGQQLWIDATEEGVTINRARVIKPDVECRNGVIHFIDTVLMPD